MYKYGIMMLKSGNINDGVTFINKSIEQNYSKGIRYLSVFDTFRNNQSFDELQEETKHFLILQIKKYYKNKEININSNQVEMLANNGSLQSPDFLNILKIFSIFQLKYYFLIIFITKIILKFLTKYLILRKLFLIKQRLQSLLMKLK